MDTPTNNTIVPPTTEQVLQIGYDCGLEFVDQALDAILNHYDCFFSISNLTAQVSGLQDELVEKLGVTWFDLRIGEAAEKIGLELTELIDVEWTEMSDPEECTDFLVDMAGSLY